jgi:hypothetical protein
MKLYKVKAEFETVILADNSSVAELEGEYVIKHVEAESASVVVATEIKKLGDLPGGWTGECFPWPGELPGERKDKMRTIAQILEVKNET